MPAEPSTSNPVHPLPKAVEEAKPAPAPAPPATPEASKAKGRSWWHIVTPIVILLLAAAIYFAITGNCNSWVGSRAIQETDDAYLRADLTPHSTRVSGTVSEVTVNDYQRVKVGDLLVQIKDDDYRAQVEQAT